eukprot:g12161.t1
MMIDAEGKRVAPQPEKEAGLIVAAGRGTHSMAMSLRKYLGLPTVALMNPGWVGRQRFDLSIIPRHDGVKPSASVIVTDGALNEITPAIDASPTQGLLLVGGPSKHHGWDEPSIQNQIDSIIEQDADMRWTATGSRRTPSGTDRILSALADQHGDRLAYTPASQTPDGWVAEQLQRCGVCWVSEDSVSMVYEALTAGAKVGLLSVPHKGSLGRVGRGVQSLRGVVEVVGALVEQGHRAIVVSSGGRLVDQIISLGGEHVERPIHKKSPMTLRHIGAIRRLCASTQADVLHARSRVPAWLGYLAWRGMPKRQRPAWVTTVHGLYSVSAYSKIMASGQQVEVVSNTVRDYVLNNYPSTNPDKLFLNHRGVDPSDFPYGYQPSQAWRENWEKQYPELKDKFVITLAGRITRLKGHHDLFDAVQHLQLQGVNAHALIVGSEDPRRLAYAKELRESVVSKGLSEHVTFTGHRSDIKEVIAVSDAVVSLSTKPESFGRSVLEAVRLGRPVVGYDHGGVGEILGEVYPEGRTPLRDSDSLVDRLAQVASGSVAPPGPIGDAFLLSDMLDRTIAMYREAAAKDQTEKG